MPSRKSLTAVAIVVGAAVLIGGGVALGPSLFGGHEPTSLGAPEGAEAWPKTYTSTLCREWLTEMTPSQRLVGAADLLTAARRKSGHGAGVPPDVLVTAFRRDVSVGCTADIGGKVLVTDIAAGISSQPRYQAGS